MRVRVCVCVRVFDMQVVEILLSQKADIMQRSLKSEIRPCIVYARVCTELETCNAPACVRHCT